jgi:precorrin-6B methylase 2
MHVPVKFFLLSLAVIGLLAAHSRAIAVDRLASDASPATASSSTKASENGSSGKTAAKRRPPRYEKRANHDPNGIGKFYLGREIAHVMGYQGISWLERPERESEEHLVQLVDSLKLTPGMAVSDIGAGSGVISFMLARKVGPTGTVLAVDIQEEMLSVLSKRAKQLKFTNVKPVHGTIRSPNLKPASVDLALMVDVYHEFSFPYEMLSAIAKSIKPGGRVVFVEYRKEDPNVPILLVHKMSEAQVKREAGQPEFGLRFVETMGVLPRQHIIVFERR